MKELTTLPDPMLNVGESARLAGVSVPTFWKRVADGTFPQTREARESFALAALGNHRRLRTLEGQAQSDIGPRVTDANMARQFWSAAYFYRRAPDRDRTVAVSVLKCLSATTSGLVQSRAADIMKEIDNEPDPSRAG